MHLKEYLFYHELHIKDFADKIGVHRQTLYKIVQGKSNVMRTEVIEKIVAGTDGKVSIEDLMNEGKGVKPTYPQQKQ